MSQWALSHNGWWFGEARALKPILRQPQHNQGALRDDNHQTSN